MNLRDLDLKISYKSCGSDDIATSFLIPALKCAKLYQRSVGFFSSGVLIPILDGIIPFSRNGGKIQLIASPKLSEDDVTAINSGYAKRDEIIEQSFTKDFAREIDSFDDVKLQLLAALIEKGTLDIKIAVTETAGDYHDKFGILQDSENNAVVFYGSANSSINGYKNNYEKIRVVKDWIPAEKASVADEQSEFNSLWDNTNPFVKIYSYKECAVKNILQVIENRKVSFGNKAPIKLRDYQEEAIQAWIDNEYHGFYVMATGTGKTWTAIFSAKALIETHPSLIVICAPYKHLIKQWAEDVVKVFPTAKMIMVSSENPTWESQMTEAIIHKKYNSNEQIIIISTIASFKMCRFNVALSKSPEEKLLIVDEAHRFTERSESLHEAFHYTLGLSATPYSGSSADKGNELMKFFGGQVFNLPIEDALEKGFLVPYHYYPIYVHASDDEQQKFQYYTQKIISCFKNNRLVNPDLLVKSLRNRLRAISMSEEKMTRIDEILNCIQEEDHFVVYCGDGRLLDSKTGEDIRHIQAIKKVLTDHDYKTSQFTAQENINDRMVLVDSFNKGEISALAAIRCLDEGINIPSIKSALILSSNDDYREFVQRRGRILRQYKTKKYANIYDVVVLPSYDLKAWAKIEFRRFHEYARLALNWDTLKDDLETQLTMFDLSIDDVDVFDYENVEEPLDE